MAALTHEQLSLAVGYCVPTLESALEQWPDVAWNIEIKDPQAGEVAAPIIRRFAATRQLLITSFWHTEALEIHRQCGAPWGALVSHRPLSGQWLLANLCAPDAGAGTVVWSYDVADPALLAEAATHGLRNFVYGPHSPEEHQRLLAWEVDAVITDFPHLLRSAAAA